MTKICQTNKKKEKQREKRMSTKTESENGRKQCSGEEQNLKSRSADKEETENAGNQPESTNHDRQPEQATGRNERKWQRRTLLQKTIMQSKNKRERQRRVPRKTVCAIVKISMLSPLLFLSFCLIFLSLPLRTLPLSSSIFVPASFAFFFLFPCALFFLVADFLPFFLPSFSPFLDSRHHLFFH